MSQAGLGGVEISGDPLKDSVMLFAQLVSALISIGVVLVVQGAIIDELESGTAEWVLSKPVSRAAYILSKFVSSTVGTFATMLVIPAFVLYFEVGLLLGEYLDPWRFAQGMFALAPLFVFLTGLSLMIGTFSRSRAVVAGVPIALLLGQQLLLQVAPWLSAVLPYSLPVPAGELVFGETLTMVTPLAAVPLLGVLFTAVGVWRFSTIDL
jgi:ABC-2 type transport system permease protein